MKKFLNFSNYSKNLKLIECENLSNDLLFVKYDVSENDLIKLNNNQNIILVEKGKVLDIKEEKGIYEIKEIQEENNVFDELIIQKAENENLCVIFLNKSEIIHNKYIIDNPIRYIDWKNGESSEIYIKLEGFYDFRIEDTLKFLSKVIGLRNHFSKQELIEKIRKYIISSIEKGINEISEEYKLNIDTLVQKSKELEVKLKQNEYDVKLLEYGIKLLYFDVKKKKNKKKKFKFFKNNS